MTVFLALVFLLLARFSCGSDDLAYKLDHDITFCLSRHPLGSVSVLNQHLQSEYQWDIIIIMISERSNSKKGIA